MACHERTPSAEFVGCLGVLQLRFEIKESGDVQPAQGHAVIGELHVLSRLEAPSPRVGSKLN